MIIDIADHKILGPVVVEHDSAFYYVENGLTVQITKVLKERNLGGTFGGGFDDTLVDIYAEISFRPSEWRNTAKLFALLGKKPGQRVYGGTDKTCIVHSLTEGNKYTWSRAAITTMPNLGLGLEKDLFASDMVITCLRANAAELSSAASVVAVATSQSFSDTSFDRTKLFDVPYGLTYGDGSLLEGAATEEGIDVAWDVGLEPITFQGQRHDFKVISQRAVATCVPVGISESDLLALQQIQGEGVAPGTKMSTLAADLVIAGEFEGSPQVTLHNCYVRNSGYRGGIGANTLAAETEFVTTREFTSGITLGPIATLGVVEVES